MRVGEGCTGGSGTRVCGVAASIASEAIAARIVTGDFMFDLGISVRGVRIARPAEDCFCLRAPEVLEVSCLVCDEATARVGNSTATTVAGDCEIDILNRDESRSY